MAKRRIPRPEESDSLQFLSTRLDERQLRVLLRAENNDLTKPEKTGMISRRRLANLLGGSGRLTEAEAERISFLRKNSQQIQSLNKRGRKEGRKDYQVNRAIRTWVDHGKGKDEAKTPEQIRAIKSLRFLGVDPDDGIFYVKGRE